MRNLAAGTCFFEADPTLSIARRAFAEGIGTMFLMLAIGGAGVVAQRLAHGSALAALAVSAIVASRALIALIVSFGPVSGGHFNPLISSLQWLAGERRLDCTMVYVAVQSAGAIGGALLVNFLFDLGANMATTPVGLREVASELVATAALMIVVFACARSGRRDIGPVAVGAWLAAAMVVMPSGSYANPSIVLAALVVAGPAALSPHTALLYLVAQIAGGLLAFFVVAVFYPAPAEAESGQATVGVAHSKPEL